jgi:hypothetical protein
MIRSARPDVQPLVATALADVLDLLCGAVLRGTAGLSDAEAAAVLAALFGV